VLALATLAALRLWGVIYHDARKKSSFAASGSAGRRAASRRAVSR